MLHMWGLSYSPNRDITDRNDGYVVSTTLQDAYIKHPVSEGYYRAVDPA